MLMFASAFGLQMLARSKTWGMDGTFGVVPKPFYQLYSILAELDGKSYPCMFCFLPNKKGPTYKEMLEVAKREVSLKGELQLEQVLVDFEAPVITKVKEVFGRAVRVTGCQVHFFRNLHKKQGEIGNLLSWSMARPILSEFFKAIHGLCYVPTHEVPQYYQALIDSELKEILRDLDEDGGVEMEEADDCREALVSFLDYLEKNYVGHQSRVGWSMPRYPPSLWNQVENALSGGQLSTNRNEGYHSRLAGAVKKNASLWALINEIIDVEAETRAKRDEDRGQIDVEVDDDMEDADGEPVAGPSNGQHPGPGKRWQMVQARRRLKNIILKREEYSKVAYLKCISHLEAF
jgi:hypothetical protein